MTDLFLQIGLSNACLALVLAIVAMVVGAKARRPQLPHMLWLLVFVKLVTPPIVTIPIITIPGQGETAVTINENSRLGLLFTNNRQLNIETSQWSKLGYAAWNQARVWLLPIWLLGCAVVFAWSAVRVCRFMCLLAAESEAAPAEVQTAAAEIAGRLGLKRIPAIHTTSARLSPLVWWAGGNVRIVLPATLLKHMDAQHWRWVLAHELAHVRRRDHLVRWLEWLACVCFWWNPVVWWARRNLRAMEEVCCDDLVISCLNPKPKFYANSLLSVVEFLACPAVRPPAMASEINSGGFLERRFKMIVSKNLKRSNCRWLQICVLLCAVVLLPLGIASAADHEAVSRRLRAAVAAGELTPQQARAMMGVLKKEAGRKETDIDAIGRRIRMAVAAGEITKEEGRAKMAAIRKKAGGDKKRNGGDKARDYLMKVRKELGAAVEAGRISEEDAKKRYKAAEKRVKERMAAGRGERSITIEEYKRAEAKMRKMVEDGKAKPEDVERRLIEMRKMTAEQSERTSKRISREDFAKAAREIRKAIAEGKITEEQGRARLAAMRKMIAEKREGTTRRDVDWDAIKRRIEGAVKSGKMTRKEADAKYEEIKKRTGKR